MPQTARCPSCGAPVEFKSTASVTAVCDYCRTTLIRRGEEIANIGRMAELVDLPTRLQRGAAGVWRGRPFRLVGRLQLRYEQGLWNEWHLLFDDGRNGWLAEAGDEYVLTELKPLGSAPPAFAALATGQELRLNGRPYLLTNLLSAECVAGEGELPFEVGAGYASPAADLRDESGGYATLDYSEAEHGGPPLFFEGEAVDFNSLRWTNLRQDTDAAPLPEINVAARALDCPSCGNALTIDLADVRTVGCGSCGAVLEPKDERLQLIGQAQEALKRGVPPTLTLGSEGSLRGEKLRVVGFLRRSQRDGNVEYPWHEYLLVDGRRQYWWLVESDGHWNLGRVLAKGLKASPAGIAYAGSTFKHFQTYEARVAYVVGQFPWRLRLDERAQVMDYVAPPRMISQEKTDQDLTWTAAEYVPVDEIAAAFRPKSPLAKPRGIYADQPNPHRDSGRSMTRWLGLFVVAALGIHFALLALGPGGKLLTQDITFRSTDEEPVLTKEFVLAAPRNRLQLAHKAALDNNWVEVTATLVNADTGESWQAGRELSFYSGVEDGERWSEGSRKAEQVFADLPPGRYRLALESDLDPASPPVRDRITLRRAGPHWSSLFILLGALLLPPVVMWYRRWKFEIERWADSDHPIITSSGVGSDGGDSGDGGDGGGGD